MLKKLLIASLFVGGGVFFIKKILPQLTGSTKDLDVDLEDIDSAWRQQQIINEEMARKTAENLRRMGINPDGSFGFKIDFTDVDVNIKENLAEQFGVDEFWNPNNLSSYKGLEGWTLGLPNVNITTNV